MKDEKSIKQAPVHFRTISEKFCARLGDNVIVMHTVSDECESFKCMSADTSSKCTECKNNLDNLQT